MVSDKVLEQILSIRESGVCNMLDANSVQVEANSKGYYDLVIFIEEHRKEYAEFILTGQR